MKWQNPFSIFGIGQLIIHVAWNKRHRMQTPISIKIHAIRLRTEAHLFLIDFVNRITCYNKYVHILYDLSQLQLVGDICVQVTC